MALARPAQGLKEASGSRVAHGEETAPPDGTPSPRRCVAAAVVVCVATAAVATAMWMISSCLRRHFDIATCTCLRDCTSTGGVRSGRHPPGNAPLPTLLSPNPIPVQDPGPPLYGLAYSSWKEINVCPNRDEVRADIAMLKKFTTRARTYGTGCPDELDALLEATEGDADFQIFMGIWIDGDPEADQEGIENLVRALDRHPRAQLYAISCGNEVLLRGSLSEDDLVSRIRQVRTAVRRLGDVHNSSGFLHVPVMTVEPVSHISSRLIQEVDLVGVNIHPFLGRQHLTDGPDFGQQALWDTLHLFEIVAQQAAEDNKIAVISEVGWPAKSETGERNAASMALAGEFLSALIQQARDEGLRFFWFELYDSLWKRSLFPGRSYNFSEFNFGLVEADHITYKGILNNLVP